MKIAAYVNYVNMLNQITDGSTDANNLVVPYKWVFDDGTTWGGQETDTVAWSTLSTALSLNTAIKNLVIADVNANSSHTFNALTDELFLLGGFVEL